MNCELINFDRTTVVQYSDSRMGQTKHRNRVSKKRIYVYFFTRSNRFYSNYTRNRIRQVYDWLLGCTNFYECLVNVIQFHAHSITTIDKVFKYLHYGYRRRIFKCASARGENGAISPSEKVV